jgi:hypothetical protein
MAIVIQELGVIQVLHFVFHKSVSVLRIIYEQTKRAWQVLSSPHHVDDVEELDKTDVPEVDRDALQVFQKTELSFRTVPEKSSSIRLQQDDSREEALLGDYWTTSSQTNDILSRMFIMTSRSKL